MKYISIKTTPWLLTMALLLVCGCLSEQEKQKMVNECSVKVRDFFEAIRSDSVVYYYTKGLKYDYPLDPEIDAMYALSAAYRGKISPDELVKNADKIEGKLKNMGLPQENFRHITLDVLRAAAVRLKDGDKKKHFNLLQKAHLQYPNSTLLKSEVRQGRDYRNYFDFLVPELVDQQLAEALNRCINSTRPPEALQTTMDSLKHSYFTFITTPQSLSYKGNEVSMGVRRLLLDISAYSVWIFLSNVQPKFTEDLPTDKLARIKKLEKERNLVYRVTGRISGSSEGEPDGRRFTLSVNAIRIELMDRTANEVLVDIGENEI